ncbi:hypothetical protein NIES4072_31280 [Nostoc commune NIES-4072]|uniref:Uncharacterized protein n=1 Tax=Nostoc commune NIES-4072 TaxID=2005467 RepID=A0A2R5FL03_NOSCO|nr:hypothetical protein [Nostoc commune]BBD69539.1 hypothetical protein NIES4070_59480 [Nostoc commune HK-02]GBG19460.1 hypothetical protein NIES4072_31280 [Nostoc commune NIES-4072]
MVTELDSTLPSTETKQYSDEEITKILNTAQATRKERDAAAAKAKELETKVTELSTDLEKIKGIDPNKYQELEKLAQTYEERKLEEQRNFSELKERWTAKEATLMQQVQQLQETLKQNQIVNALEKSFYATGGKSGKDDDGYTYFDLIRDRAINYIVLDDSGKITIIDPRDKTPLKDTKGVSLTVDDLMLKLRSGGPTASLFEPIGNGAGSGMTRSQHGTQNGAMLREQIMALPRSERIAKARELGIK